MWERAIEGGMIEGWKEKRKLRQDGRIHPRSDKDLTPPGPTLRVSQPRRGRSPHPRLPAS